ncbi:MAG: hypothetical protein M3O46_23855, partial [Myxococcota bacterium]|nr:hypothetical protein [Myxococcota bacterium]
MKWSTLGITLAMATAGSVGWSVPARAQAAGMVCGGMGSTLRGNDTNCTTTGTTCGTDVCSWATNPHRCVAAGTDPGWCGGGTMVQAMADLTCKCHALGATCDMATNHCTFTTSPDGGGARDSGAVDSGSAGDT